MSRLHTTKLIIAAISALAAVSSHGGAYFQAGYRRLPQPSPNPGEVLYERTIGRWPDACFPVHYSLNTTIDPIPDPGGAAAMSLAEARVALESALQSFNDIRTSYAEAYLDREIANTGVAGIDFINEVTFRSEHLGLPSWVGGLARFSFVPVDFDAEPGLDYDGDGDADFVKTKTCRDVDGDGDIEFPAGRIASGTILESDIYFFPQNYYYADIARYPRDIFGFDPRVDLEGIAAHEFGHGLGLNHSLVTDFDLEDGTGATMNPGIGTDGLLSTRTLHSDDITAISYLYPEGSRKTGPAALQKHDIAFDDQYVLITGEVRDKDRIPVLGAHAYALDHRGALVSNAVSGKFILSYDPETNTFGDLPASVALVHGKYELAVPRGLYHIGLEAADGFPLPPETQNQTVNVGASYGQNRFPEEFWSGPLESAHEIHASLAWPVLALRDRRDIDFVINDALQILAVEGANLPGSMAIEPAGVGWIFASRIPKEQLLAVDEGRGIAIQAALIGLTPFFEEEAAFLEKVMITTGEVNPAGGAVIDLEHPLVSESQFRLDTLELNSMHVPLPAQLGNYVRKKLVGTNRDLFVVAVYGPDEHELFPGFGISPVASIRKPPTPEEPRVGNSYASLDGGLSFIDKFSDLYFGLVVTAQ